MKRLSVYWHIHTKHKTVPNWSDFNQMIVFVIIFISNSERALPIKILKELQTSKIMIWMNVP